MRHSPGSVLNIAIFTCATSVHAADLYVATTGADASDCLTPATACATIQHAVDVAAEGSVM